MSVVRRLLLASSFIVLSPNAFAVSIFCPELEGTYRCQSRDGAFSVRIVQDDVWLDARYIFQIQGQPAQVIVTNGVYTPFSIKGRTGQFAARCSDDRLLVRWQTQERGGRLAEFRESYSIRGNSLVTVRTPVNAATRGASESRVCQRVR